MSRLVRSLTPMVIFLSGLLLIPYFSWPDEAFSWQSFADTYGYRYGMSADR
ncbi:MAG: hypothetical protein L6R45_36535 [Anaerolineae bacterium]|nr:hypothetical protein [Anaerolineae bacterium]